MCICRHFSGSKLWDCERRLAFKEAKIQSNEGTKGKEPKKDLKDYVARIFNAEKGDIADTVYGFLKNDSVIDPQKEVMELRRAIEGKIRRDPDIQKMTVAELDTLMKGIPDDQNKLVGFLFANGIIEADEYNKALALGVQNRPKPVAKNSNTAADVGTPKIQSESGVKNSPIDATSKAPSEPTEEEAPRTKTKSSPADKGSILKDEKYWNERVVREREESEQFKRDVAGRFKDVTPKNKEAALANLREEMGEMQQELEQLQRDRDNAANQKMLNRPDAARRYSGARRQQMGEAYQKYSAELRDVGSRLIPLTKEYNLLNEQHMRLSGGKRFGEWRKDTAEYAEKLNQQQKRDQALAMKMDREYEEEQAKAARNKAEGDRVLGLRSRDPIASRFSAENAANRDRVAKIMGWDTNVQSPGASPTSQGGLFSIPDRGVNLPRYQVRSGTGGTPDALKSPYRKAVDRHIDAQGGAKFMKEQNALREQYADQMDDGKLQERFKGLKDDPRAQEVFAILARRTENWAASPQDRYGDLAWARSQLEALQKADKEQTYMNNNDHAVLRRTASLKDYAIPVNTIDPYLQISLTTPPDAYGKTHRVLIQPNRLQQFWGKNDAQVLLESGVWFEKDTWASGKVRGLKFHFTKQGIFEVNGTPVAVGAEAVKDADSVRESRNKSFINKIDFAIPDGASVIRVLRLPKRTNVDLPIPQSAGVVDAGMGISLIREKGSKNLRLTFSEEGDFQVQSVNTRMQDFRILRKAIRVSKDSFEQEGEEQKNESIPTDGAKRFASVLQKAFPEVSEKDVFQVLKQEMGREYLSGKYYGIDEADYILDAAKGNNTWEYAKAIKGELGISLAPFNKDKMDNVFSLLSIAHDPLALPVIRALKNNPSKIGFTFAARNMLDLEQDRSAISIVSKRLTKEGWRQGDSGLDQHILQEWVTLRTQQERSFSNSPELDEQGKPKPIDVVVIYDKSLDAYLPGVEITSRALNVQQGAKAKITKICTNDYSSLREAMDQYEIARSNAVKEGRHLVAHVILHGSPEGISVPLKSKSERYNADTILQSMNRKGSTVFIASCFGGEHLERRESSSSAVFKDVAVNTRHIVNSLDYNETEFVRIPQAYQKDANGHFNADINKDGKVTLNEVKYWLDVAERFHDPISYDDRGNQLTENRKYDTGAV